MNVRLIRVRTGWYRFEANGWLYRVTRGVDIRNEVFYTITAWNRGDSRVHATADTLGGVTEWIAGHMVEVAK